MYQLLSESAEFCIRYDQNILAYFFVGNSVQGGSKKVSCWHSTTAYFFWATLYIRSCLRSTVIQKCIV